MTAPPVPSTERRLPITADQVVLLNECEAATRASISRTDLVIATILAGHGLRGAIFQGLEPGDPPTLVVTVPGPTLVADTAEQSA